MSDRMKLIPFKELLNWILTEYKQSKTVFGVQKAFVKKDDETLSLFNEKLETPLGPAAGPNSQLAQNIVASYVGGSRFFELKTVQTLDGENLPVAKPCITIPDEGYNCEWSTELEVPEALEEYIKGWFLLKLISKEFGFGSPDGFIFNMSVGYDFEGITSKKIDDYIEGMKNAEQTAVWAECKEIALSMCGAFKNVTADYINKISPVISQSITLSTLHGCPPAEIEKISSYLINTKKIHTFVKCNPTMLGYEFARKTLDDLGFTYMDFDDYHFLHDLQFVDAVPMIGRLKAEAEKQNLTFGVKITNTFPQKVPNHELPSDDMYMSGRSLYPLSITLANRLSKEFNGDLRISYSGGADAFNIKNIFATGVWPITVATTILKPGGYNRFDQMAEILCTQDFKAVKTLDVAALDTLAIGALTDPHHQQSIKPAPSRKLEEKVPLVNCFVAPCQQECPIAQDVPEYIRLNGEGKHLEALKVITNKNPLPFMTGTICAHHCMDKCTRNFYESPVCIRDVKLDAVTNSYESLLKEIKPEAKSTDAKVGIIGGGPAGLSAGFFLARKGVPVTIFEEKDTLGGIVNHVIPDFRIASDVIEKDVALAKAMGVTIKTGVRINAIEELKAQGFDYVIIATGAWLPGAYKLEGEQAIDSLEFLEKFNTDFDHLNLGKNVVVIGGGNTAMDTARAAKRVAGVENVRLVYRRDARNMPADEEELEFALEDGVELMELLSPEKFEVGVLTCRKMVLGSPDASGRRRPENTDEFITISTDSVIAAVGARVDKSLFVEDDSVFITGDALRGPATVVEAIADARKAADTIIKATSSLETSTDIEVSFKTYKTALDKKGIMAESSGADNECNRCLECSTVCEVCTDVCPNRANIAITVPGYPMRQIIHVDRMCNECGNCLTFCPYASAPYKDKFTMFHTLNDFNDSNNSGFLLLDKETKQFKIRLEGKAYNLNCGNPLIPTGLNDIIEAMLADYSYLF
ncbi:MAG: putative selenate reductase subunit YgfK [Eubacteriaceae bacterium]